MGKSQVDARRESAAGTREEREDEECAREGAVIGIDRLS